MSKDNLYTRIADMWYCDECNVAVIGRLSILRHHIFNHFFDGILNSLLDKLTKR